jgi:hypothetical protein
MAMNIPITQPPVEVAGDLEFTQPLFHFGQVLEDKKGDSGFVIGMDFDGEWNYTLFYINLECMSKPIPESECAIATTTIAVNTASPLL